jgi:hypothetical protein
LFKGRYLLSFYLFLTLMLKQISGKPRVEWYTKTASTPIKNGNPVIFSSGKLINGTVSSTAVAGIILRDTVSTDADYASAVLVPVNVPTTEDIFEADVKTGVTAAATSIGAAADFYIGTGTGDNQYEIYVDTGTNTHHNVTIVGFVSASKVLVKLNNLLTGIAAA